jgi:hypothetical protein
MRLAGRLGLPSVIDPHLSLGVRHQRGGGCQKTRLLESAGQWCEGLMAAQEAVMERRGHPGSAVRGGHLRRCLLAIVGTLCAFVVVGVPDAGAQDGSPVAGLDVPTAAECTVQPRSVDELRALFREVAATPVLDSSEASPTPAVAPTGAPADEQTVAEINATWRQYIACITSGDQARMFALLSDNMVRRQLVVDVAFGVTEEALFAYLAATPVPIPPDQSAPFVPLQDVRVLNDGRVAAIGPGEQGRGDVRIFVREGDRWLLDDWFDLS